MALEIHKKPKIIIFEILWALLSLVEIVLTHCAFVSYHSAVPIDKILGVQNARAWVSMVSYLKNKWKLKY